MPDIEQVDIIVVEEVVDPLLEREKQERFEKMKGSFEEERELQADNRYIMDLCERFYDNDQYDDEEIDAADDQGAALSMVNICRQPVNWLTGAERKTRLQDDILPRSEDDVPNIPAKKKVMKYLDDTNHSQFLCSEAFKQGAKAGLSWIGLRYDEDGEGEEPIKEEQYSWRHCWHDSKAQKIGLTDARHFFIRKRVDVDIAIGRFPEHKHLLTGIAENYDLTNDFEEEFTGKTYRDYDGDGIVISSRKLTGSYLGFRGSYTRQFVDLVECWYKIPSPPGTKILKPSPNAQWPGCYPNPTGEFFDPRNPLHVWAIQNGFCYPVNTTRMQVRCMVWCGDSLLGDWPSPYRHNRIPFVPIWAYRDYEGNFYGVIRSILYGQKDFNKRLQRILWLLSERQFMYQKGAIDDPEEFARERAKVDGRMECNDINGVKINTNESLQEASQQIQVLQFIYNAVTQDMVRDEQAGLATNADSGVAIRERKSAAALNTWEIFDNYTYSRQLIGELKLSMIQQFMPGPRSLRIVGNKRAVSFEAINSFDQNGNPLNDIVSRQADYIVTMRDYSETYRMEMVEYLGKILERLNPQVAFAMLDVYVDMFDLDQEIKDVLVKRIRKLNGQKAPEQEGQPPTPEEQQAMQEAQVDKQLVRGMQAAQTDDLKASAEKKRAEIQIAARKLQDAEKIDAREMAVREATALANIQHGEAKIKSMPNPSLPRAYRERGLLLNNQ